jgi:hypothetical protein
MTTAIDLTPRTKTAPANFAALLMPYAHIFKARASTGHKFVLILSEGFTPSGIESYHNSKAEAKAAAAAAGAKAWNY